MIKASDLKVGDKFNSLSEIEYEVIENNVGDVLFILNKRYTTEKYIAGLHLFYDDIDDVEYAKYFLNVNLSLA